MSRRRNSSDADTINLFPFLAVLICTVGALIVLLVVLMQQARAHGRQTELEQQAEGGEQNAAATADDPGAEAALREQLRELRQATEDQVWQTDLLRTSYEQTVSDLAAKRAELSHVEDHYRRLESQINQLRATAESIQQAKQDKLQDAAASAMKLEATKRLLAEAEAELKKLQDQQARRKPSYALIPYDGPNGTRRQPIYIECRADRVVLQPEGIEFGNADFEEPLGADNPLAAALRAKREFLVARGLVGIDREPYPLLVVRPQAATSYAAARAAMKAWEAEFGYELIEEDLELEYGAADPSLRQTLEQVVAESRQRQQAIRSLVMAAASRVAASAGSGEFEETYLRASPGGGFERVPVSRRANRTGATSGPGFASAGNHGIASQETGTVARSNLGQGGRGQAIVSGGSPMTGSSGSGVSGIGASGANPASRSMTAPSGSGYYAAGDDGSPGAARGTGSAGPLGGNEPRRAGSPTGSGPGNGNGSGDAGSRTGRQSRGYYGRLATGIGNSPGAGAASGNSGNGQGVPAASGSGRPTDGLVDGGSPLASIDAGRPNSASGGAASGPGGGSRPAAPFSAGGGTGRPNGQALAGGGGNRSGTTAAGAPTVPATGSAKGQGPAASGGNGAGPSGGGSSASSGSAASGSAASGDAASSQGGSLTLAFGDKNPAPSPPASSSDPRSTNGQSLADSRGRDWALPGRSSNAVGITRPIRITCEAERLILHPERGTGQRLQSFAHHGDVSPVVDPFVDAIQKRLQDWGIGGHGIYWKPVLEVHVGEGAELAFDELTRLLDGSGVQVIRQ